MKKTLLTVLALAGLLSACQKAKEMPVVPARPVTFSVENLYSLETKADAIATGKHVAVYAGAPINKENVSFNVTMNENSTTAGTLTPTVTNSLLWGVGQTTQETKFLAVYPHETVRPLVGEAEAEKYIDYAIASAEDVAYAAEFLAAAASQAPGTGETPAKVALNFKHPFVKLVYNVTNTSDDAVASVKISGIRRTGHLMFATGAVTTTGEAVAANAAVTLNYLGEGSYMTVVMPESTAVNPVITVVMASGAEYAFALAEGVALEAGKVYTAGIQITGSHGTEQSDRTVLGTFTVTDWTNVNAGSLTATGSTPAAKWWYLEGNIDEVTGTTDGNWGKHIPFKCVSATVWTVDFYYAATETDADHGFKIRYAADVSDWSEAYGKDVVIDADHVLAVGADGDHYLVSGTSTSGTNIRISAVGKYRINFYTDTHDFHIYKITE